MDNVAQIVRETITELIDDSRCVNCGSITNENLRQWFQKGGAGGTTKGGWDRYGSEGQKLGKCGGGKEGGAYAACLSAEKAKKLGPKGRASFVRRKRSAQKKGGDAKKGKQRTKSKKPTYVKTKAENTMNEMKSLKQLLSKVKGGKIDKKTAKDLDNLVTRGDGFVVITKSKKDGYNRFNANRVDDRGIEVVPHYRDFKPGKVKGMMRHKPEHLLGDINWKDVKDIYMESKMNLKLEELVGKPITEAQFDEAAGKKDACYRKVKARYDVWPSAYASGALVKCRKVGAANWGNKSKKESVNESKKEKDQIIKYLQGLGFNERTAKNAVAKSYNYISKAYRNIGTRYKGDLIANILNKKENVNEVKVWSLDEKCWKGYEKKGTKKMFGKVYPNCVKKEGVQTNVWLGENELYYESNTGESGGYSFNFKKEDVNEAEYQGRKVKLGKIMQGDAKKFKVYVKNPKGNVVKVNFGQGGDAKGGTMRIRKSNPKARANFRARHNCDNPGPRHKARYWSCRKW